MVIQDHQTLTAIQREARRLGYRPEDALWAVVALTRQDRVPDIAAGAEEVRYWMRSVVPRVPWPPAKELIEQNVALRENQSQKIAAELNDLIGQFGAIKIPLDEWRSGIDRAKVAFEEALASMPPIRPVIPPIKPKPHDAYPVSCQGCHYWQGSPFLPCAVHPTGCPDGVNGCPDFCASKQS